MIPPRIQWDVLVNGSPEVLIDQTYFVTGVGTVVGGTVMSGVVSVNQNMLLGPDGNGLFVPVQVSIDTMHTPILSLSLSLSLFHFHSLSVIDNEFERELWSFCLFRLKVFTQSESL
jgi:GTPase